MAVTISRGFWMGKYEVTQEQYQAVMDSNPSNFQGCGKCPVESMSWDEARNFIQKLNAQSSGGKYRLPTEAEWEYAARAGTTGPYAGNLDEMGWYGGNSDSKTHPVGQKKPNDFRLYDMHGNVWEWCEDLWHGNYDGAPTNGSAWTDGGNSKNRVVRGGSWLSRPEDASCSYRYWPPPDNWNYYLGFRVVLSLAKNEN